MIGPDFEQDFLINQAESWVGINYMSFWGWIFVGIHISPLLDTSRQRYK